MVKVRDPDAPLKRLGGGRWQTRDERFTVEPQSGTWVVVDAEQTDELGLPLVTGPFGSLTAVKEAIGTARGAEPAASPLTARAAKLRDRPAPEPRDEDPRPRNGLAAEAKPAADAPARPALTKGAESAKPETPAQPKWIRDFEPTERRRAKRLIDRLTEAGAGDAEGIVRRDIVGDVPAVAAFAVAQAIIALGADASPISVTRLLASGRDENLGVRWRLVDGDDRPMTIDLDAIERG